MRKSSKVIAAAGVAGLALAGGAAFTGTGVATSGQAASAQFVGGTVSQSVTGATLSDILYGYYNTTNVAVTSVTLTFSDANADGKVVTATPSGGTGGTFTCENVGATTPKISTCTFHATDAEVGYVGLTSLSINVASTPHS